jgi:hypothetical protein
MRQTRPQAQISESACGWLHILHAQKERPANLGFISTYLQMRK